MCKVLIIAEKSKKSITPLLGVMLFYEMQYVLDTSTYVVVNYRQKYINQRSVGYIRFNISNSNGTPRDEVL